MNYTLDTRSTRLHNNPVFAAESFGENFQERFWLKVKKTETCWLWIASVDIGGYGKFSRGSGEAGEIKAHIASWIIHNGLVPKGLHVLHRCDVRRCIHPDHLWLGTLHENVLDAMKKGRHCHAETHGMHRLSWGDVKTIRSLYPTIKRGFKKQFAKRFHVTQTQIQRIISFKCWKIS